MKLQVIYSKQDGGQEIANFPFNPDRDRDILASRTSFLSFCLRMLEVKYSFSDDFLEFIEKPVLKTMPIIVKLSGCVLLDDDEDFDEPEFWKDANGKVYVDLFDLN